MLSHRLLRPSPAIQPAHLTPHLSPTTTPCLLHLPIRHIHTQPPLPQPASSRPIHHHPRARHLSKTTPAEVMMDKWGWVIYRTTYTPNSDGAWARFRARVDRESRGYLARSEGTPPPERAAQLEWVWVEDRARLDGVSRARLRREVFPGWVGAQFHLGERQQARNRGVKVEEGGRDLRMGGGFDLTGVPRYAFFVQVDEEALRSLGEGDEWDNPGAHVKFVDANWEPMSEEKYWEGVPEEDRVEKYDEIDGCRQENVGWMCISPYMLGVDFYEAWYGVVDTWYTFYRRPPVTLNW